MLPYPTASEASGQSAPRRILFVDDEPRILDGIARMLRPQRAELEVLTAKGGPEALTHLRQ